MRTVFALLALALAAPVSGQQTTPVDIDPNTRTQGGADVRDSGANAGARDEEKTEKAEIRKDVKDKPVAERKPREQQRETEEAAKGESAKPQ